MANTAADNVVIRNILYMIAYATGTSGNDADAIFADALESVGKEEFDGLAELFAVILSNAVKRQHLRGLERAYQPQEESLAVLRGRPLIQKSLALKAHGAMRLYCSYDSRAANTYMNQIAKASLNRLVRNRGISSQTRKNLKAALFYLVDVDDVNANMIDWRRVRYNKLNQSYRFLMSICQMVLENSIPLHSEKDGFSFPSLLSTQRLSSLFENFIREYFRKHFPRLMPRASIVDYGIGLKSEHLPSLHTDVVLTGPCSQLVIDTKCYGTILRTNCGKEILSPAHRNQIFSYVMHCACRNKDVSGMLLYAQTALESPLDECWYELGHWFFMRTLDLSQPFENIAMQLDRIGNQLISGRPLQLDYISANDLLKLEDR